MLPTLQLVSNSPQALRNEYIALRVRLLLIFIHTAGIPFRIRN